MTIIWALVWVLLMSTAIGHMCVTYRAIENREASSPLAVIVRPHTIIALACLLVAFFIPSPSYASSDTETEITTSLNLTFQTLLRELPKLETKQQAEDLIRMHIIPMTDTQTAGRLMLGKWWLSATTSQRDRFVAAMTDKLVSTYSVFLLSDNASEASFEIVRVSTSTNKKGTRTKYSVVSTVTVDRPVSVTFTIIEKAGKGWGLIDVKAEGISLVLTWRQAFGSLIRKSSDIEKVITDLETGKVKTKNE